MNDKLKLVIIDDHKIMMDCISQILEANKTVEVIGCAMTGKEGVEMVLEKKPDIVILDIGLPDLDGVGVARMIYEKRRDIKIIVLSMHSSYDYIVKLFSLGIDGYVLKDESFQVLDEAISCVQHGSIFVSRAIADGIARMYLNRLRSKDSTLTKTEEKVLLIMLDGKNTKEIACELNISDRAVNNHKQSIFSKFNIDSEAELVKYTIDNCIISKK